MKEKEAGVTLKINYHTKKQIDGWTDGQTLTNKE